ncbi:hypothetical protein PsorP6_011705 [Peronosclerospora sorghi]|uniref:Uncharacterized protein n=1 Tax=Peronosclerospora sorghi TaxID=230839 RepID=A0ACC0WI74_9STRA|nr:hypothetical protein PsorP6_011705 [Peronosclerospora sorghi]
MENAIMHGGQELEKKDENLELVKAENRTMQEHMDMMDQEHEKHLEDHYKSQRELSKDYAKPLNKNQRDPKL